MERLKKENYAGVVDGKPVGLYALKNARGMEAAICNWGARVAQILTPDVNGRLDDVIFGYDTLKEAREGMPEMGATVGRVANRIAGAQFELAGRTHKLAANDGPNNLHSGPVGCMRSVFDVAKADERSVRMSILLPDGMDGFPGNCTVSVTYSLSDDNELSIVTEAVTDATTVVNFCNHAYFNLAGSDSGVTDILGHKLELNARHYTPIDETLIPTGAIMPVAGTPFDFTTPRVIGERINGEHEQLKLGLGYDHNFVLEKPERGQLTLAARLSDPVSGRVMEVRTTEPGIQFYAGNFLQSGGMQPKYVGKGGKTMLHRGALCLETQRFPDSVHRSYFPSMTLDRGEKYVSTTTFRFGV